MQACEVCGWDTRQGTRVCSSCRAEGRGDRTEVAALLTSVLENARGAPVAEQAEDDQGTAPPLSDHLPVPARPTRASGRGDQIVLREIAPGEDAFEQRPEVASVAASLLEAFQQPVEPAGAPGESTDRLQRIEAREQHDDGSAAPDNWTARTNTLDDSAPLAPPMPPADEPDVVDPSGPTVEISGRFANLPTVPLHPVDPVDGRTTDAATVDRARTATGGATSAAEAPAPSTSDTPAPHDTDHTADVDEGAGVAYVANVDHTADTDHTTDMPQFLGVDDTGDIGATTDTDDATTAADWTTGTGDAPAWVNPAAAEPAGTWNDGIDLTTDDVWDAATASVDAGTVPESRTADLPPADGTGTPETDPVAPDDTAASGDVTGDIAPDPDAATVNDGSDARRDVTDVDDRSSLNGVSTTDGAGRTHDDGDLDGAAPAAATAFAPADTAASTEEQRHLDAQPPDADDARARDDDGGTEHLPDTVGGATTDRTAASDADPAGNANAWTTVAQVMLATVGLLSVFQIVVLVVVYRFLGEAGADPTVILAAHTKVTAVMLPALVGGTFAVTAFAAWRAFSTPTRGLRVLGLPVALWAVLISATLVAAVALLGESTTILQARQMTLWAVAACALLGMACVAAPRTFTETVEEHASATAPARVRV